MPTERKSVALPTSFLRLHQISGSCIWNLSRPDHGGLSCRILQPGWALLAVLTDCGAGNSGLISDMWLHCRLLGQKAGGSEREGSLLHKPGHLGTGPWQGEVYNRAVSNSRHPSTSLPHCTWRLRAFQRPASGESQHVNLSCPETSGSRAWKRLSGLSQQGRYSAPDPKGTERRNQKVGTQNNTNSTNVPSHLSPPAGLLRGKSTILLCFSHQKTWASQTLACHRGPMPLGLRLLQHRRAVTLSLAAPQRAWRREQ